MTSDDPTVPTPELSRRDQRLIELLNANARIEQGAFREAGQLEEWRDRALRAEALVGELRGSLAQREARVEALLNSLSWRLTSPLRTTIDAARRLRGSAPE